MYYSSRQDKADPRVAQLREECGVWLKSLREKRGLSQRQLSEMLGFEFYSFISQIESGKGRVPVHQIAEWARILDVPTRDFAANLMRYYDPINYELLFGDKPITEIEVVRHPEAREAAPIDQAVDRAPFVPTLVGRKPGPKPGSKAPLLDERISLLEQKALEERVKRLEALLLKSSSEG